MTMFRVIALSVFVSIGLLIASAPAGVSDSTAYVSSMEKVTLTWTASGGTSSNYVRGLVYRAVLTVAGSTGATATITVADESGVDILGGSGVVATNVATAVYPSAVLAGAGVTNAVPVALNDKLVIATASGGTNTTGTLVLYVKP